MHPCFVRCARSARSFTPVNGSSRIRPPLLTPTIVWRVSLMSAEAVGELPRRNDFDINDVRLDGEQVVVASDEYVGVAR